jgi:uncharacterized protein YjdB
VRQTYKGTLAMTFKHKLSRRLALLRNVLLLGGVCVVASCDLRQLLGLLTGVASVFVNPPAANITVGGTLQLTATVKDSNGVPLSDRVVTWASSVPSISTVSPSGLVTGMATGATTITATSEGQSGAAVVTVETATNAPVAYVTMSPTTASVAVGQTAQLVATPKDASGNALTGRVVTWASTVPAAATVDGSGLVSGVAAGAAAITATSEGQIGAAAVTVTVTAVPVASVGVSPATASVAVGQTAQLVATPKDASGNALSGRVVTWVSSAPAVATVNGTGRVTGVAGGAATITATSEGKSGSAAITVTTAVTNPGTVTNLAVTSVTTNGLTLSFTEVNDGTGQPAKYDFRYAVGTISFGSATNVSQGTCVRPVLGTAIGATRTCTILGLTPATGYQVQLASYRGTLDSNAVFGGLSNVASGTTAASTAAVATVTVSPASASVAVGAVEQFTATLRDASGNLLTGRPVTWGSSSPAIAGVSLTGLVTGLVVGSATITATSEGKSGTATVTVTVTPAGGVIFESNWSTATGTSNSAVRDGTRWGNYWEFNNGDPVQLLSVVAAGPAGYPNALRVLQRGATGYAAVVQQDNLLLPSKDYYVRFYMRNDDTSPSGDHIVTPDIYNYGNLTYIRKMSGSNGWQFVISMYGCDAVYPFIHMGPDVTLALGTWYRFEYFVHFVDPTHMQVHVRVYNASGTQILGDADFRQEDWGAATWNGRSDWTLASLYNAGYRFCTDPVPLQSFAMGNNGQQGSVDTGLFWYFAGVQIRTDRWPGP